MSEKYQMFFETYLEDTQFNHKGETVSVHPKTLESQKESMMGHAVTPSKMTQKDTVCITGLKNEQGEFVVESISRSGSSVTALAQELYPQDGSESLTPKDEKEAAFEAYTSPQSVEIEGVEFSVDGPLAGKIVDLERASSDGAHDLFEAAEKNMELSLHMNHNIGDAVREQRAAVEQAQSQTLYMGYDMQGNAFASKEAQEASWQMSVDVSKDDMGHAVVSGFKMDPRDVALVENMQAQGQFPMGDVQDIGITQCGFDIKVGEPLLVNTQARDALDADAQKGANDLIKEVVGVYPEMSGGEALRTREDHERDLMRAPERVAEHAQSFGMDAR